MRRSTIAPVYPGTIELKRSSCLPWPGCRSRKGQLIEPSIALSNECARCGTLASARRSGAATYKLFDVGFVRELLGLPNPSAAKIPASLAKPERNPLIGDPWEYELANLGRSAGKLRRSVSGPGVRILLPHR